MQNPYPKEIEDEISGVNVPNRDHKVWAEGYNAGFNDAIVAILSFTAKLGRESFRKCLREEGGKKEEH